MLALRLAAIVCATVMVVSYSVFKSRRPRCVWLYKSMQKNYDFYQVGYFTPDGEWSAEEICNTREEAAGRVSFLNGAGRKGNG